MNARDLLHKGCGERNGDGVTLHHVAGKREKQEKERERRYRFILARSVIVNLEAADIELDDDYRVARYSQDRER